MQLTFTATYYYAGSSPCSARIAPATLSRISGSSTPTDYKNYRYPCLDTMHHQLRTIISLATSILLLGLLSPPTSCTLGVNAAVVPGRMLNTNHEEIFAQQAKELQRTKAKGRKPVSIILSAIMHIMCAVFPRADSRTPNALHTVPRLSRWIDSLPLTSGCRTRR